ncbi:MAG: hypothetical protein AVDCRST_MAG83-1402 [uncultured Arthrobacter sp.]|uniref:Uncharacterized protein n=1 Tax=uncultured Arthrobacter sp. TaxID=114050 RepID=A0A6J4HY14_9MICC|nr:MAG: hypothetical protein AVDCRST_MAG83-1402 [uncultured Arthrobacter sp.]
MTPFYSIARRPPQAGVTNLTTDALFAASSGFDAPLRPPIAGQFHVFPPLRRVTGR